ncbi:MAG: S8 family serine peptidase [Pseudomonadales bacterium]|nr:S8 family serine peptidase [Pseudomonadales bacterium]
MSTALLLALAGCSGGGGGGSTAPVNEAPLPAFTLSVSSGIAPLDVAFDATASSDPDGRIVTWRWDFGDGSASTGPQVSHVFNSPGTYDVQLTVTDDDGRQAGTARTVEADQSGPQGTVSLGRVTGVIVEAFDTNGRLLGSTTTDGEGAFGPIAIVPDYSGPLRLVARFAEGASYICDFPDDCVTANGRIAFGDVVPFPDDVTLSVYLPRIEPLANINVFTTAAASIVDGQSPVSAAAIDSANNDIERRLESAFAGSLDTDLCAVPAQGGACAQGQLYRIENVDLRSPVTTGDASQRASALLLSVLGAGVLGLVDPDGGDNAFASVLAAINALAKGLRQDRFASNGVVGNDDAGQIEADELIAAGGQALLVLASGTGRDDIASSLGVASPRDFARALIDLSGVLSRDRNEVPLVELDTDGDGVTDLMEVRNGSSPILADTDGDGVDDAHDAFPLDDSETTDTDGDGIGNVADDDDDGDGVADARDPDPLDNLVTPPTARIVVDATTAPAPAVLTFDASGTDAGAPGDTIVHYSWSFGDGSEGVVPVVQHTYTSPGVYEVILDIENSEGFRHSASVQVEIVEATGPFGVSGSISVADSIAVDSDVNDSASTPIPNDTLDSAQRISNPVQLGGYLNQAGGGPDYDGRGKTVQTGDLDDVYRFHAAGGEVVNLVSIDPVSLDIDLYLVDEQGTIVDYSQGTGEFESVTVPAGAGTYYVVLDVFTGGPTGGSNYILRIGDDTPLGPAGYSAQAELVPDELIVQMDPAKPARVRDALMSRIMAETPEVRSGGAGPSLYRFGARVQNLMNPRHGLRRPGGKFTPNRFATEEMAARYRTLRSAKVMARDPAVRYAEPNYMRHALAEPNDPRYPAQWHYRAINLPEAWDLTTGSDTVVVAVVDTGIVASHPDLAARISADGYDFISFATTPTSDQAGGSRDGDGADADPADPGEGCGTVPSTFHGTHVAGTIGAATDNGIGVAGVTWRGQIMPLRALGACGSGTSFDVMQAVLYAAGLANVTGELPSHRADVINLSLGSTSGSRSEQDVYAAARAAGVIIIAAAGNNADSRPGYPASYPGVVSVSATSIQDRLAYYSSYGSSVDVAAPGGDSSTPDIDSDGNPDEVLSTQARDGVAGPVPAYQYLQGTSMATPHVAGVVALMKAVYPDLSPDDVDRLLASGEMTDDLGPSGRDDSFGYGRIDALKAVRAAYRLANQGGAPATPATLSVSPDALNFGQRLSVLDVDVENAGGGTLTVNSVSVNDPFVSVTPPGSPDGLGIYHVAVDRSGLGDGVYQSVVQFSAGASSATVTLRFEVATTQTGTGDAGIHYVVLLDPDTLDVIAQVSATLQAGRYQFDLGGTGTNGTITAGAYLLLAGTDRDNNGFICEEGEACGAYRTLDLPETVFVNGEVSGLEFSTRYLLTIQDAAPADKVDGAGLPRHAGIRLLPRGDTRAR